MRRTMDLQHEALLMLENRGTVLDTARTVSRLLRDHNLSGAVIGGIAVVLHGHLRTTRDVDVLVRGRSQDFADALAASGATFDAGRREFLLAGVPVHPVPESMALPARINSPSRSYSPVSVISLLSTRT